MDTVAHTANSDNVGTNRLLLKIFVAHMRKYRRTLISLITCWLHRIPNCAKYNSPYTGIANWCDTRHIISSTLLLRFEVSHRFPFPLYLAYSVSDFDYGLYLRMRHVVEAKKHHGLYPPYIRDSSLPHLSIIY